jgi:poly(3-hydroxybutyrate) depolymerase
MLGRTTRSIDASELMWSFFQQHPWSQGAPG